VGGPACCLVAPAPADPLVDLLVGLVLVAGPAPLRRAVVLPEAEQLARPQVRLGRRCRPPSTSRRRQRQLPAAQRAAQLT
jgi:hypothetical protein